MFKKLFILLLIIITNLNFSSCQNDKGQNLDINVNGRVTDENNNGVANVIIFILRGALNTGVGPTNYYNYTTVTTNSTGNYQYLVKDDGYDYELCCGIPSGYTSVDEFCRYVNNSIIHGHTIPNFINFKLIH